MIVFISCVPAFLGHDADEHEMASREDAVGCGEASSY